MTDDSDDDPVTVESDGASLRRALSRYFDGDVEKIAAALAEYDGTYPSFAAYVRRELEEHLEPYMLWLLDRWTDMPGIANDWLTRERNWLLADADNDHLIHVFLARRPTSAIDERGDDTQHDAPEPE